MGSIFLIDSFYLFIIHILIFRKLATVLIQRGKLLNNSILVAGTTWGKVRKMMDHQNKILLEANPSDAIQILGWKDLPQAGLEFIQVCSDVIAFIIKILLFLIIQLDNSHSYSNYYCHTETC